MKIDPLIVLVGLSIDKPPIMTHRRGRRLHDHALMYIVKGRGTFEDETTPKRDVGPGNMCFQFPGKWHCFDPSPGTVWTEYWVLFRGAQAEEAFGAIIPKHQSVFDIGADEKIIEAYQDLHESWLYGGPAHGVYRNYLLHKILITVHSKIHGNRVPIATRNDVIYTVKKAMRRNLHNGHFDLEAVASEIGVRYESLRKRFKEATGIAPHQYFLREKINHAKELLMNYDLSVRDVASSLGFDDPYYFSRLFKKKEGIPPLTFKKRHCQWKESRMH